MASTVRKLTTLEVSKIAAPCVPQSPFRKFLSHFQLQYYKEYRAFKRIFLDFTNYWLPAGGSHNLHSALESHVSVMASSMNHPGIPCLKYYISYEY